MTGQKTHAVVTLIRLALAAALVLLVSGPPAMAKTWTAHTLGAATLRLPEDWYQTYSDLDLRIAMSGYDVAYQLKAAWVSAGDPLLDASDIAAHAEMMLAGQPAVLGVGKRDARGIYLLAFTAPRPEDNRRFVLKLTFNEGEAEAAAEFFDQMLSLFSYGGDAGGASLKLSDNPKLQDGPWQAMAEVPTPETQKVPSTGQGAGATVVETDYVPVGEVVTARIDNAGAVSNGPTQQIILDLDEPIVVHSIQTYHWNDGKGRPAPGMIALRSQSGEVYGPWQAIGAPGQGGVPNAYWRVEPEAVLVPDRYEVLDSEPETWATNDAAGNKGFVIIDYQKLEQKPAADLVFWPFGDAAPEDSADISAAPIAEAASPEPMEKTLFDGAAMNGWTPVTYYGGEFETHAQLGPNALSVAIPEGSGWATVGLASAEPVMAVPAPGADTAQVLTARMDFATTDTLILAFADADQVKGETWTKYDLRLMAYRGDDGIGNFRLDRKGAAAVVTDGPWPEGESAFSVALRPDGLFILRNGNGSELLRAEVPESVRGKTWHLRVYARPVRHKNGTARLTLAALTLSETTPVAEPDPDRLGTKPDESVLFDGSRLGTLWARFEDYENYFRKHAAIDGGLVIDRAAETDNVRVGITSKMPVVWLDRFTGAAEARLEFILDGADATGLEVSLTQPIGGVGKTNTSFVAIWARDPSGTAVTLSAASPQMTEPVSVSALDTIPDRFTLVLTPGQVAIETAEAEQLVVPFAAVQDGAGLRLSVVGRQLPGSDETRLKLTRIVSKRVPGAAQTPSAPALGVAPLPMEPLFDGTPGPDWQRQAPGGLVFDELSAQNNGGIRLFRQDDPKNSHRVALVSAEPLIATDRRILVTPFSVTFRLDPEDPHLSGRLVLSKSTDPLKHAAHEIGLEVMTHGPMAGRMRLGLHTAHFYYDFWDRYLPADWHRDHWDGSVQVVLGDGWIGVTLGAKDGPGITLKAQSTSSRRGNQYHLAVLPGNRTQYDPGSITLRGIETGWVTPDGMDEVLRQTLLDTEGLFARRLSVRAQGLPGQGDRTMKGSTLASKCNEVASGPSGGFAAHGDRARRPAHIIECAVPTRSTC